MWSAHTRVIYDPTAIKHIPLRERVRLAALRRLSRRFAAFHSRPGERKFFLIKQRLLESRFNLFAKLFLPSASGPAQVAPYCEQLPWRIMN